MTVKECIKALQDYDSDTQVVILDENNKFKPIGRVSPIPIEFGYQVLLSVKRKKLKK